MSMPAMDRPSVMLAHMMDRAVVDGVDDSRENGVYHLWLACQDCGEPICDIDDGDTVRVLLNTALAHEC